MEVIEIGRENATVMNTYIENKKKFLVVKKSRPIVCRWFKMP